MRRTFATSLLLAALAVISIPRVAEPRPAREEGDAGVNADDGAGVIVVPFDSSNDLIVVNATLDGKGPFRFVLDTGATRHAITPQVAKELGLKVESGARIDAGLKTMASAGVARVARVEIGGCTLADQVFFVAPLPASFPFQGFLGAEVFRRFAVAVDFRRNQLTLTPTSAFTYKGDGAIIPLKFYKRSTPMVRAAIDGDSGWFKIDTGYNGALALFAKFVAAHKLHAKYAPQTSAAGGTTIAGEVGDVSIARVPLLKIGTTELRDVDAALYRDTGTSNDAFAGAIGTKIFARFNVIFDYRGGRLILDAPSDIK
jgi:predicted aspartyl protease